MRNIKITVLALFFFGIYHELNAQAFDGFSDRNVSVSYAQVGSGPGVHLSIDAGATNYLSVGGGIVYLLKEKEVDFYTRSNYYLFVRCHFIEILNYSEKHDLYVGFDLGGSTSGPHAGYKFMLNDEVGVELGYYYGMTGSVFGVIDESENLFKGQSRIIIGFVYNR